MSIFSKQESTIFDGQALQDFNTKDWSYENIVNVKVFKDGVWLDYKYACIYWSMEPEEEKKEVIDKFKKQNKIDYDEYYKTHEKRKHWVSVGSYTYPEFINGKYKRVSIKLNINFRSIPTDEEYYRDYRNEVGKSLTHSKIENYKAKCEYYNIPIDQSKIDRWESLYK